MKCFYHSSDLDGHCSGAIVKYANPDCEMFGLEYGDKFPWDLIEPGETVVMVDVSLTPYELMYKLASKCHLVWIDHHKSAMKFFDIPNNTRETIMWRPDITEPYNEDAPVILLDPVPVLVIMDTTKAACELTWEYLYPDVGMPIAVHLLGRYDVWDHRDPRVLPFQYGMRAQNTNPEAQVSWQRLLHHIGQPGFLEDIIQEGGAILRYVEKENRKYVEAAAFPLTFEGLRCIAVNILFANSQLFNSVWNKYYYHAMLTFGYRHDKWVVLLYTTRDDVDVSKIAMAHGGGGHKKAAGFTCEQLPREIEIGMATYRLA